MSRSYRRTPIIPFTTAPSDKPTKVQAHREERAAVRAALASGDELPDPRLFGDPCLSEKDGKRWWGEATAAHLRK